MAGGESNSRCQRPGAGAVGIAVALAVGICLLAAAPMSATQVSRRGVDYGEQVRTIDQMLKQQWTDFGLRPSPAATDGEWCRRVFLDIIGRVPTVEELDEFEAEKSKDKKGELVQRLLYDEKYTEEYARNWTTVWTNLLIGRSGGTDDNSMISREGMQKYLRDSFARNKPYNNMVRELVTATGSTTPGTEKFNGAVNYLIDKVNDEKATLATAATARLFLGLQVQCTQCHNHPFNDWKQQKFWDMNAFFRQARALRRFRQGSRDTAFAELVDEDFAGENGDPSDAITFYEMRDAKLASASPVFIDGTSISNSGLVRDVNRRAELAKLMLESEYLEKALVNRYWAHFFGYGFTKPVDDMGSHNQPSHPELLDYLAGQVRENSYNLKELIRWITLSQAYGLSCRVTEANEGDDPALGELPKFSHFYMRQMRAEELYESLVTATQAHKSRGSYEEQERAKANWLGQFVTAFGNDEGEEATTFNGTIPQALMMFNGDLMKDATSLEPNSFLWTLARNNKLSPAKKIHFLFRAGLARNATQDELVIANKLLVAHGGDAAKALQDIWWAVLNSNEFILNH